MAEDSKWQRGKMLVAAFDERVRDMTKDGALGATSYQINLIYIYIYIYVGGICTYCESIYHIVIIYY